MGNPFESHPRVFVVDDEISIAKMLSVILQIHLFDATSFADPLAWLQNSPLFRFSRRARTGPTRTRGGNDLQFSPEAGSPGRVGINAQESVEDDYPKNGSQSGACAE
jgi:hypothetical protein